MCPSPMQQMHTQLPIRLRERRASPRVRTVFFMVKITRYSDVGLFRARNISDTGMSLIAHDTLQPGERVQIELSKDLAVAGSVAWREEDCCGLQFDEPIDSGAFLKSIAQVEREYPRSAVCLPVMRRATSYSEAGIHAVQITDVSPRGLTLAHVGPMRPGMFIRIVLESGATRHGAVCWARNGYAGVLLAEPFALAELESAKCL